MALLRKLLYKKPPDGLFDVFERIYVFDSCFRTTTWEQDEYKGYVGRNITRFKETYPEAISVIINLREGNKGNKIQENLSQHYITIMDYPRHYEGCPLLSMKLIYHFLKSSTRWLSLGQHNMLLMHSELGGWPLLAFLLAALLLYRNNVTSESRALEMIHKEVPPDHKLTMTSRLDPSGSQLRYLQYVSKRNAEKQWLPADKALRLDCVIIRMIPDFNGKGGCCPVFKIYGRDPSLHVDKPPKLLFSTPRWRHDGKTLSDSYSPQWRRDVRSYNQLENKVVESDINCNIQGDVVLECIDLNDDMVNETIMYRVMFNTAFIKSNILTLNREEVDIYWDKKDQFPKEFKAELLFSEVDASRPPVRPPTPPAPAPPKRDGGGGPSPETGVGGSPPPLAPPPKLKTPPLSPHISWPTPPGPPRPPPPAPSFIGGGIAAPSPSPPIKIPPILIRKTAVKSQSAKRLKHLHWSKMNRVGKGSLWAEVQKSGEAARSPKFDELETLFSVFNPTSDNVAKAIFKAANKVQLIELRRAFNCEIMLSKVKIPLPNLMDYVLAMNDSAMDVNQVDNLIKCCPTKEEMILIKDYKGEREKLGKCEQFFIELMKVPRSEAKLITYFYKLQFSTQVSDLRDSLNTVYLSAEQITSSVKLRRVMLTILDIGNALNQGTHRGAAVGFKLGSLLKLNETRTRSNKMTLMHYLCKVLAEKMPELLDFSKELNSLEPASKIYLSVLKEDIQEFTKGFEKVVQEKKLSKKDGHVSKRYRKSLKKFIASAEPDVKGLSSLYNGMGESVDAIVIYVGEDPASCPYESVVSTLLSFVRMFNGAHEENCKQIEAEKKAAYEAAQQEKLKAAEQDKLKEDEKEKLEVQNHSKIEHCKEEDCYICSNIQVSESIQINILKYHYELQCLIINSKQ